MSSGGVQVTGPLFKFCRKGPLDAAEVILPQTKLVIMLICEQTQTQSPSEVGELTQV